MIGDNATRRDCFTCFYGVAYAWNRPRGSLYVCALGKGYRWVKASEPQFMECHVEWGRARKEREEAERESGVRAPEPSEVAEEIVGNAGREEGKGERGAGWPRHLRLAGAQVRVDGKWEDAEDWVAGKIERGEEWWRGVGAVRRGGDGSGTVRTDED